MKTTHNHVQPIQGIHHITAIADSAASNFRFYTEVLGLRLVKKTVNFDDPYTYHLYYGDEPGHPGTLITFFPWEGVPRGKQGTGQVTAVAFAVPVEAITFWKDRLAAFNIRFKNSTRFGDPVIAFEDAHGMPLELVGVSHPPEISPWRQSPVDPANQLRGFHSATATVKTLNGTDNLLSQLFGMQNSGEEDGRTRFRMNDGTTAGTFYDLIAAPDASPGRMGSGTVHHIAFRTPSEEIQRKWRKLIGQQGYSVTPVIDRNYFRSIYFRESGGVLFELATDPPGFTVDEHLSDLGTALKLPQQHEPKRREIEAQLPPLEDSTEFRHVFVPSDRAEANPATLVALHGTGGSEHDLLPVAQAVGNGNHAIISPRGKVLENGLPRFFRRLAEGVLDEADVKRRANELADFLNATAPKYGLDVRQLTALGFSNGANIAAAIMLLRPDIFKAAILFRPMLPISAETKVDLSGVRVLVSVGKYDRVIPASSTQALIRRLQELGAEVTVKELDADHGLTKEDIQAAQQWLAVATRAAEFQSTGSTP